MIKTYDDYFIPVYKTRRTAAYPEAIEEQTMANDGRVKLVENGNGLKTTNPPRPSRSRRTDWRPSGTTSRAIVAGHYSAILREQPRKRMGISPLHG